MYFVQVRSRCRLWDAQAREDADLQPFIGSTGSLKRAPVSVSVFSTHACIERQQALHFALLLYPIVTSSRHKKSQWLPSCLCAPRQRGSSYDPEPPTPAEFPGPCCLVVLAPLGHTAGLLSTLHSSRKWHQQLKSFLSGRYWCVPACLLPKCWLVWIWSSLGDCICAGKYIKKTWYLRGGKTHPKCRWIPDQTQRRNSSKHLHLSPAFWMQMQYGQVPYSCCHSVFSPLLDKCQTMSWNEPFLP